MTDTVAAAPESGALTIDQAVEGLLAMDLTEAPSEVVDIAPEPEPEEVEEEPTETEVEPTTEEDPAPEEPAGEVEPGETEEPATPAVQPPPYWDDAAKAEFAQLSPKLQAVALEQWKNGERVSNKALEEAATVRKAADAEIAQIKTFATQLNEFLPKAVETFQSRWGDKPIDWVAVANERGVEEATKLKFQFDAEQETLQRLNTARQDASRAARQAELRDEAAKLQTIAPHLTDPKEGAGRRQALARWLIEQGAEDKDVENINALATAIAWKAYQADQAGKAAAQRVAPPAAKPPSSKPAPAKPVVKPSAAPVSVSTPQRTAQTAMNRFAQTRSIDDAVAAIIAKG